MLLYKNSDTDRVYYSSEIPGGGVVTGLAIDVTLQPVEPWTQYVYYIIKSGSSLVKATYPI